MAAGGSRAKRPLPVIQAEADSLEQAEAWLQEFALMAPERARQRLGFIDQ